MKFPWRKSLRYTGLAVLLALLLGFLCLQTLPSLFGYPAWVSKTIAEAITPKDGSCSMGAIHGGIFTGFEIENFSLEAPTETGVFQLTVPAVGFDLRLGSLLIGHIQPKEAYVRNAELQLLLPGDETHPQDSLSLRQFTGNIHITSYHVLQAQARGIFQGTQLNADATLLGIHDLRQFLSPDEKGSSLPQNLVETLKKYHQEFNNITERAYDSFLSVSLTANPEEWSQCTLQGTVGISDATICGLLLPTVRGAFTYQENLLNVQDFQILYDATETLAGKGVLDLTRKTFRGSFWADLMPATFIQMLSLPADILPRNVRFNTPIHFSCDLPDSPCDLAKLSPDLFFSCDNILVSDLRLNKLSGLICFDKNILDLKNLQLYVGATAEEIINGEPSTGAQNDLERLTRMAYGMIQYYGMSEKVGNLSFYDSTGSRGYDLTKPYSDKTAELMDEEVKNLVKEIHDKTYDLLTENKEGFLKVAALLLEKEVIFADDVESILGPKVKPTPDE